MQAAIVLTRISSLGVAFLNDPVLGIVTQHYVQFKHVLPARALEALIYTGKWCMQHMRRGARRSETTEYRGRGKAGDRRCQHLVVTKRPVIGLITHCQRAVDTLTSSLSQMLNRWKVQTSRSDG